ncbi:MAG: hypothetical protein ACRDAU_09635 [Clostridium sp.]
MMNGIVIGSILKFESKVTIPASGAGFAKLKFLDPLSEGLAYIDSSATVNYIDASAPIGTPPVSSTGFTTNYDPVTRNLSLFITDTNITNPSVDTTVLIAFKVIVTNALLAVDGGHLTNSYTFSMLSSTDTLIGTPVTGLLTEALTQYPLFVMGVPQTINKVVAATTNAIYFFGAATGYANPDLVYSLTIEPSIGFDFPTDIDAIKVTIGSINGPAISNVTITKDPVTNNINVKFPQADNIKDLTLFVRIPLVANSDILTVTHPAFIYGTAVLTGTGGSILATTPKYSVQINLLTQETPKSLTNNSKTLIS